MTESRHLQTRAVEILDALGEGITIHDADGEIVVANRAAREILHLEESELLARSYTSPAWDITTVDGRPLAPSDLPAARAIEEGVSVRNERIVVQRPGADPVVLSVNAVPLEGHDPGEWSAVISFRDITEQHGLEEEIRRREEQYGRILTEISDVVSVLHEDGTIRYESPSIEKVFGYRPEELVGRPASDLIHPDDLDTVAEAFFASVKGRGVPERTVQYRFRHADGSWRQVESTSVVPDDETLGPVVVTRDITGRIEAEQKFRAIFETNPSAIGLATLETGEFVEVNSAFLELLGHAREEVLGATAHELGVWAQPEQRDQIVSRLRETGSVHNLEAQFQDVEGNLIDVLFSGVILELGGDRYLVGVAQDITQRKAFEKALEHRTLHDQLTELPNRTLFHDRLRHAVERVEREGNVVAVLFLDLDRFKAVNDSLGHAAGDRVLRMVASRLANVLRSEDTVARVGGDEFAVLLETVASTEDIDRAVTRLRQAFEVPFEVEDTAFSLTASIGVAHSGIEIGSPDDLIRLADAAMYRIKQPGRTDFHVFDPSRDWEVTEQLQREAALERAVEEEQFVLHYQPVVRLGTGEIAGVEALVRWQHPEQGLVRPEEFIPLAEETGLIVPLGQWVLEESLRQHRKWRESGVVTDERFRVSVNLSPRQHEAGGLNEKIREAAREAGASLSDLMLEITETVAMTGADTFQPLREEGLAVGIDDFGTGYSSLEYLRHFNADVLKLDRSFIANLAAPDQTPPLVEGILQVADNIGMTVTAEGIETEEQLEILRGFGCPYGQGWLFSRAVPADAFAELYRDQAEMPPASRKGDEQ